MLLDTLAACSSILPCSWSWDMTRAGGHRIRGWWGIRNGLPTRPVFFSRHVHKMGGCELAALFSPGIRLTFCAPQSDKVYGLRWWAKCFTCLCIDRGNSKLAHTLWKIAVSSYACFELRSMQRWQQLTQLYLDFILLGFYNILSN